MAPRPAAHSASRRPARVLLVTRGNAYLERAFTSLANARVTAVADLTDPEEEFDVTVLDDVLPTVWPKGNTLAIRSAPTKIFIPDRSSPISSRNA